MLGVFAEREGGQGDGEDPDDGRGLQREEDEDVCVHVPSIACAHAASIRAGADHVAAKPQSDVLFGEDPPVSEADQLGRLRVLVDAGIALSSELSLEALLQRIVETAAEITGAEYAALGVIDKTGQALERFLTTGSAPTPMRRSASSRTDAGSSASFATWRRSGSTTSPTTPFRRLPRITRR